MQAGADTGGFVSYAQNIDAKKIRGKSQKFFDHFSQAAMFFNSLVDWEQEHLVTALQFELGKLEVAAVRERMVGLLAHIDKTLASRVAKGLGIPVPANIEMPLNRSMPADAVVADYQPISVKIPAVTSAALSMANRPASGIKTRKVAILAADGVDNVALAVMQKALAAEGAQSKIIAPRGGTLAGADGIAINIDCSLLTAGSVLFDAVYIPGGEQSIAALKQEADALHFIREAYTHCKSIAATSEGCDLVESALAITTPRNDVDKDSGIILGREKAAGKIAKGFIKAISRHRHWEREKITVPA